MKSIHYISIALLAVTSLSCDKRFDFLSGVNLAPEIYFNGNKGKISITDSLKTSIKTGKSSYAFSLNYSDPEKELKAVAIKIIGGDGVLKKDGVQISGIDASTPGGSYEFEPKGGTNYTLSFTATDAFDKSTTAELKLAVFNNLPPVAVLEVTKLGINSLYEYQLDARKSRDRDVNSGGAVKLYHYVINGTTDFTTSQSTIRYDFPGLGGQEIKLNVIDNDGTSSPVITFVLTIN